jgi:hypothetical protein
MHPQIQKNLSVAIGGYLHCFLPLSCQIQAQQKKRQMHHIMVSQRARAIPKNYW